MKTIRLPDDTAQWLSKMLEDEYPADEELVEQYPGTYRHVANILQAIDLATAEEVKT